MSEKVRPYEHLSDPELNELTDEAAKLRMRVTLTDPRDVIAVLTELGCPRADVMGMLRDPTMRLGAFRVYFDSLDARLGDQEAKDRLEFITTSWSRMRKARAAAGAAESELEARR